MLLHDQDTSKAKQRSHTTLINLVLLHKLGFVCKQVLGDVWLVLTPLVLFVLPIDTTYNRFPNHVQPVFI